MFKATCRFVQLCCLNCNNVLQQGPWQFSALQPCLGSATPATHLCQLLSHKREHLTRTGQPHHQKTGSGHTRHMPGAMHSPRLQPRAATLSGWQHSNTGFVAAALWLLISTGSVSRLDKGCSEALAHLESSHTERSAELQPATNACACKEAQRAKDHDFIQNAAFPASSVQQKSPVEPPGLACHRSLIAPAAVQRSIVDGSQRLRAGELRTGRDRA